MANDIDHDQLRPISELIPLFPLKRGRTASVAKIRRWIARGVRGVRLQGQRIGGEWYSSAASVESFVRSTNPSMPAASKPDPRKARKVRRALEAEGFDFETEEEAVPDLLTTG